VPKTVKVIQEVYLLSAKLTFGVAGTAKFPGIRFVCTCIDASQCEELDF